MSTSTDPLFQPYTLKHLKLKNRLFSACHEPFLTEESMPKERYRLYHEEKAKGGIGISMIGGSAVVSQDSPGTFGNVDLSDDRVIPWLQKLADTMHRYDCATITQITHMGRRSSWAQGDWLPLIWSSCQREMAHRRFPKIAEEEDIARIIKDYGQAARRAKEGGLDGVEILAFSHLAGSFVSPSQNFRDDDWGGSLEKRMRFNFEVIKEVRKQVGDDYIVGLRVSGGEGIRGGGNESEAFEIMKRYADSGLVDYLNIVWGASSGNEMSMSRVIPPIGSPSSPFLDKVKAVKARLDIPILHSCGIADVATARHALQSDSVDLVGMTRAHIADPHILKKVAEGDEHRIRPCVGAGHCIDQIYLTGAAYCLHNPATGREKTVPQLIATTDTQKKKIVIIGAGPAGLEAARVSALRGHDVSVFEAAAHAGGQVLTAAKAPRRENLIGVVDWLISELQEIGVPIHTNRYMEAEDIREIRADIVIIATGGIPNLDFLEFGSNLAVSTWDVLNGHEPLKKEVLVYDENGTESGPSCAEMMMEGGCKIEFMTRDRLLGSWIGATNYPPMLREIYKKCLKVTTDMQLIGIKEKDGRLEAHLWNDYSEEASTRLFDQIVVEYGTLPNDDLYFELKPASQNHGQIDITELTKFKPQTLIANTTSEFRLYRIGDSVASRNIHASIYEARRLCQVF
ncbi:FAD-dependent oxidoreductase [bacterium]|jgi:2,4-dienoyl-CoA reductase-like NADH-dependent reductase (Old Yellow Enzyme family)/thioredoxin reductase|nr:FAD-dependent oxidoreductase [bacterium]MDB2375462.1 FAD-dependent oxidoreductase [Gammaproteobacteria bacterium]